MKLTTGSLIFIFPNRCSYKLGNTVIICGSGSSVGIAAELRAGRSGIESRWGRDFLPVQTGPGAHPASCKMGIGSFPGVKCGRGLLLTTHPFQCRGHVRVELHRCPLSGPHRACNGITLPFIFMVIIIIRMLTDVSPYCCFLFRKQIHSKCEGKFILVPPTKS